MNNIETLVTRIASANLANLMLIWQSREQDKWSQFPEVYRALGERILAQGEPLLAYDTIREALTIWPSDVRLRQLQGLALARSGATESANTILEKLRDEGRADEETLGMLGRTFKDLAATAATRNKRDKFMKRAAETYADAYLASGGFWTGINAATMALLNGETDRAKGIARKVRNECLEALREKRGNHYWFLATLGEAALILRDLPDAAEWYARAAKKAENRYGNLQSSRRNARLSTVGATIPLGSTSTFRFHW